MRRITVLQTLGVFHASIVESSVVRSTLEAVRVLPGAVTLGTVTDVLAANAQVRLNTKAG